VQDYTPQAKLEGCQVRTGDPWILEWDSE